MAARIALFSVSLVLLSSLAAAAACALGSMDISLPASYVINSSKAYDTSYGEVEVWGNIDLINYGDDLYAAIPTSAPAGARLAFFQDTITGALFRNNTLILPIGDGTEKAANLVLMTENMTCSDGKFHGRVTGIELDTKAMGSGDMLASAVVYLNKWPDQPSYHFSISGDERVKTAVLAEAAKGGQAGTVKLMLDVDGASIGYVIVRMKAPEAGGNASAYRYIDGDVSMLTCKEIRSKDGVVYETISTGGGTFAFVGPFPGSLPVRASLGDVLIFSGIIGAVMLFLAGAPIILIKKFSRKS